MDVALLVARLVLAVVFLVAGVAKLLDRPGSRQAAVDFGVPARFAPAVGTLLPVAEIATALMLVPTASARWGALAGLALLSLFIAGIALSMAKGRAPNCHCFGQLHSEPAGWPTLARNVVLAGMAAFIVVAGWDNAGASAFAWLGDLSVLEGILLVSVLSLLAAVAVLGWLSVGLMEQNGRILLRMEAIEQSLAIGKPVSEPQKAPAGLPVGTIAPGFSLPDLDGNTVTLDGLRAAGRPVLLIFSDPGCSPCSQLMPEIARWQRELAGRLSIVLFTTGSVEVNLPKSGEHQLTNVVIQGDRELAKAYGASGTPAAVLVRPDGTIGAPLAGGAKAVRALVATVVGSPARTNGIVTAASVPALQIGDHVPALQLQSIDGTPYDLAGERRRDAVMLFWNPTCGYCKRMLDDLLQWEQERLTGAPDLIVISTGDADATRAHGFRSTVLLDEGVGVGDLFGARGTPAAVRLDRSGRAATAVATGASAVLAELRSDTATPAKVVVPLNGQHPVQHPFLAG